jgi:phosphate starvation-inducible PhoH-like protein
MTTPAPEGAQARTTIVVPGSQPMVALLGASDEYLQLVERAFPDVDVLVRGNEITVEGSPASVGIVDSLVAEMLAMLRTGQALTGESVERSIALLRSGTRPSDVLNASILSSRGRTWCW